MSDEAQAREIHNEIAVMQRAEVARTYGLAVAQLHDAEARMIDAPSWENAVALRRALSAQAELGRDLDMRLRVIEVANAVERNARPPEPTAAPEWSDAAIDRAADALRARLCDEVPLRPDGVSAALRSIAASILRAAFTGPDVGRDDG